MLLEYQIGIYFSNRNKKSLKIYFYTISINFYVKKINNLTCFANVRFFKMIFFLQRTIFFKFCKLILIPLEAFPKKIKA